MQTSDSIKEQYFGHRHVTVIRPNKGLFDLDLREIWAYRDLFFVLVGRDIKVRYKQTVLGFAWAIIQPLTTMIIFSMIFGNFAKIPSDGSPYPIFVYSALLPWGLFATTLSTAGISMISSSHLISKVYFPRILVPITSAGAAVADFLIATVILFALMLYYDIDFSIRLTLIPLMLFILLLCSLGVGIFMSALIVSYRDFRYVLPFMIQIWMYLTPVIYPTSLIPQKWQWVSYLNPMSGVIDNFRAIILGTDLSLINLIISLIFGFVTFALGIIYFKRVEQRFADVI